jgi:hypothetical protein
MSYNEWKFEKVSKGSKKESNKFISVDDFITAYTFGLQEYLARRTLDVGHIEDLAVENAAFAEAFLITVSVLNEKQ